MKSLTRHKFNEIKNEVTLVFCLQLKLDLMKRTQFVHFDHGQK